MVPAVILFTLLLTAVMSAVFVMLTDRKKTEKDANEMRIGITGATDDPYFAGAMLLIQDIEAADFSLTLEIMTEEEAREQLRGGKLTGYAVIPEGFVDSIISGENKKVRYISTGGQAGFGTMLTKEVLDVISNLITEGQSGIYGMQNIYYKYGMDEVLYEDERILNIRYIQYILDRGEIFEYRLLEETGASGLHLNSYYICGIWLLFLLVWGISCSPLFSDKNRALQRLLHAKGVSAPAQIFGEYLAFVLLMLGTLFTILLLLFLGLFLLGQDISKWLPLGNTEIILFFIKGVPVILLAAALEFLLYEIAEGFLNGVLTQFFCAMLLGYVSGCIYPLQSLPVGMRRLSAFLPTGIGMQYLCSLMKDRTEGKLLMGLFVYILVLLALAAAFRYRRTGGQKILKGKKALEGRNA